MNFIKGAADGQVDKIIDQAADVAKEKVGAMFGGDKKKAGGAKGQKEGGGNHNMLSNETSKSTPDAAAKMDIDHVLSKN